jgi:hypothetical protein
MRKGTHYKPNGGFWQFCECASRQTLAAGCPVLRHYFDKGNPTYVIVFRTKMADWEKNRMQR